MSTPSRFRRELAGTTLAVAFVFAAVPVNLATVSPIRAR